MTAPDTTAAITRQWTEQAVLGIARESGGPMITRPVVPAGASTVRDAKALTGLSAAASVERCARQLARRYIRTAREEGASWAAIGAALGLPDDDDHEAPAVAAFGYAAPADGLYARIYGQSFTWSCPSCSGLISDQGPCEGSPADAEQGHAVGCARLAAHAAAWSDEGADDFTADPHHDPSAAWAAGDDHAWGGE